ncbi:MAG TPA: trans-2-enoyl-CoA reductase family protein [Elusimicrobiota bacterium]|nr:trans-2-enoyl-CoA reductase family protein [Elusimicrobiota bacterium]HMZ26923.1 trans-2-enoyl-CoA reductase family protein [Elusimicrobiota bacterium]HNA59766.1 trans-2-enoyl-CoA reductase family protein [Elusimicrobiota bacterium]HNF58023.1 trans-2-enoyl-CoA reductase family protein [Elusimicrobiota bacterium]
MIIEPQSKGFICLTAHPAGCAKNVALQIEHVSRGGRRSGPKNVLVIGASTGYGLASRIAAAFGYGANTLGVFFEKPAEGKRTATPGWYNTAAFESAARAAGLRAVSLNGDAFSDELKAQTVAALKKDFGPVDLVVYSLASPRRTHPREGVVFTSALKPIGRAYTSKTVNFQNGQMSEVTLDPATVADIENTVHVMGGEDWAFWIDALQHGGVLARGAVTVAYSYAGPEITAPIYRQGTIGRAKEHLELTAHRLEERLGLIGGRAVVSVNKALVTQASAAIPAMPLYISLLFRVMKNKGLHEGCIEQMHRLFTEHLYAAEPPPTDEVERIRIDDWEMRPDVQAEVAALWDKAAADNVEQLADLAGYREDFFKLFGFGFPGVDYGADVDPSVPIPSLAAAPAGS